MLLTQDALLLIATPHLSLTDLARLLCVSKDVHGKLRAEFAERKAAAFNATIRVARDVAMTLIRPIVPFWRRPFYSLTNHDDGSMHSLFGSEGGVLLMQVKNKNGIPRLTVAIRQLYPNAMDCLLNAAVLAFKPRDDMYVPATFAFVMDSETSGTCISDRGRAHPYTAGIVPALRNHCMLPLK